MHLVLVTCHVNVFECAKDLLIFVIEGDPEYAVLHFIFCYQVIDTFGLLSEHLIEFVFREVLLQGFHINVYNRLRVAFQMFK